MELIVLFAALYSCIVLIYVTVVFLVAQILRDNSIMDVFYGPAFTVAMWGTMLITGAVSTLSLIVASLVSLWAIRLALRIGRKNFKKPEDARYAAWRTAWMAKGKLYFILRSYLQINLLQGIIIVLVSSPLIIAIFNHSLLSKPFVLLGGLVFLAGLLIESLADYQLDQFIKRKKAGTDDAAIMQQGLFRYSRRPNYFGESLIWWGLAIIALPLPFGYLAILSPILITYIMTKITGPMLEAQFLDRYPGEYGTYMLQTSYFIPMPPKS